MIEELFVLHKTDTWYLVFGIWYLVFQLNSTKLNWLLRDFLNNMIAKLFTKSHMFLVFGWQTLDASYSCIMSLWKDVKSYQYI